MKSVLKGILQTAFGFYMKVCGPSELQRVVVNHHLCTT